MTRTAGLFRGAELSRLVVLAVIMIAGWLYAWRYVQSRAEPVDPRPRRACRPRRPSPIRPPNSPASATRRRSPSARPRPMRRCSGGRRAKGAEALAAEARRDLLFTHLWERPERYRGVPVHLLGTARRVLSYESKLSPTGRLHEAWIFTPESQNHPYVCVFEDVPKGFPAGGDVSERVVFNGYFLKLMSYQAGDVPRAAPLLVGRLGWSPSATAAEDPGRGLLFWTVLALGASSSSRSRAGSGRCSAGSPPAAADPLDPQAGRGDRPGSPLRLARLGLRRGRTPRLDMADEHRQRPRGMRLLGQRPRYQEGPPEGAGYVG